MRTVVVFEALTEFDAQSIADLLSQNGMTPLVRSNFVAGLDLGLLNRGAACWGTVSVPEELEEKARELIAGFMGSLGMLDEAEEENPEL
jgi:hypothetical protein